MGDEPRRIQRSRAKGWKMPEGAVYVGRPSMDGNRYLVHRQPYGWSVWRSGTFDVFACPDREEAHRLAVELYRRDLEEACARDPQAAGLMWKRLRGKSLACWCPLHLPCHADVLLELANAPVCEAVDA